MATARKTTTKTTTKPTTPAKETAPTATKAEVESLKKTVAALKKEIASIKSDLAESKLTAKTQPTSKTQTSKDSQLREFAIKWVNSLKSPSGKRLLRKTGVIKKED